MRELGRQLEAAVLEGVMDQFPLKGIPSGVKLTANDKRTFVKDFVWTMLTKADKWPALMLIYTWSKDFGTPEEPDVKSEDLYIAGVDFEQEKPLPSKLATGGMYWPLKEFSEHAWDKTQPRYHSPADAAMVSLRESNGEHAYIAARPRQQFGGIELAGFKVRSWFDDEDYVEKGSVQKWWQKQIRTVRGKSPTPWKGSDDPLD